ncbi:MAG TPA: molybdopterin-synthase adenylyltransferase MoeB [Thermoplasmata archaeon]|nr:molybdopterin-synthase adenylyltransferase MoeB [Thermoplasmata archaeon]
MPKAVVRIPTPLRAFTDGAAEVAVDSTTVGGAIRSVCERHPGLRRHLLTPDGQLRNFVSVFVNEEDVRQRERTETPLRDGDLVSIVPAIAGGAPAGASGPRPGETSAPAEIPIVGDDLRRYSRHLLLPEVGLAGQRRLRGAKVLIVGTGGLGSPAALYLAAAGVGTLGLVDFDAVDLSNLQRQVLYATADVGRPKLAAAERRLTELNPGTRIVTHEERLEARNALEIVRRYDVVLDGTDNFPTRYLVNDACVLERKPNVYGSIYRFEGQVSVFDARRGPCYRCIYPEPPPPDLVPSCAEAGVLGVLPGLVGVLQATEAVKLLLGVGEPLVGRLLLYDALAMAFRELKIRKNPTCDLCSPSATQHGLIDYPAFCGVPAPGTVVPSGVPEITPEELRAALAAPEPPLLVDVREDEERAISALPGALPIPKAELTEHVDELTRARSIVVFCRAGSRSADATRTLLGLGFTNVRSLRGGINAWAERIDPTLPTY